MTRRSSLWPVAALGPLLGALLVIALATRTGQVAAPSAPAQVYGLTLHATDRATAEGAARAMAGECRDASPGALHPARGADALSSASPKAAPRATAQVRISCADARPPAIDGSARAGTPGGRLLLVFNRPDAPLVDVAFQRRHRQEAAALDDLEATRRAFERAFGAAPEVVAGAEVDGLPALSARRYRWSAGCVEAELTGVHLGPGRFAISEQVGAIRGCRG
ncbi:MAG TPA: hypothetical protein VML75_13335 [Kofleriaceae bacterium]|nr:hypothetical protein [Kofleriaceae bacterium]